MRSLSAWICRYGRRLFVVHSCVCLIAALACSIVNLAVSGTLDWALYPLLSIAYWFAFATAFLLGGHYCVRNGAVVLSVLLLPFLFLLERITPVRGWFYPVAVPACAISLVYACFAAFILRRTGLLWLTRAGWLVVAAAPVTLVCNLAASRYVGEPFYFYHYISIAACLAVGAAMIIRGKKLSRAM